MQKFKDMLETLEDASHVKKIIMSNEKNEVVGTIENKPGSLGSIKLYNHLFLTFGELNIDAALEGSRLVFRAYRGRSKLPRKTSKC